MPFNDATAWNNIDAQVATCRQTLTFNRPGGPFKAGSDCAIMYGFKFAEFFVQDLSFNRGADAVIAFGLPTSFYQEQNMHSRS